MAAKYRVTVTLEAPSEEAAERIMAERLGYDEEYGVGDYLFHEWTVESMRTVGEDEER